GKPGGFQDARAVGAEEEDAVRLEEKVAVAIVQVERLLFFAGLDVQPRGYEAGFEDARIGRRDEFKVVRLGPVVYRVERAVALPGFVLPEKPQFLRREIHRH